MIYSTGYDSFPHSLIIGDLNRDKKFDIAVTNYGTDNIGIFFEYENGTFEKQQIYTTTLNSHITYVTLADINQDDQLDILVSHSAFGSFGLFLNRGNDTFC